MKVHQERHHKEELLRHGPNAGITGPKDENDDDTIMEDEHDVFKLQSPEIHLPPKSEQNGSSPHPASTSISQNIFNFTPANRIPPFSFPGLPSIPGLPCPLGLPNFANLPPHVAANINPALLAGLLKNPHNLQKDFTRSTPPPNEEIKSHFPLNFSTFSKAEAEIEEIDECDIKAEDENV